MQIRWLVDPTNKRRPCIISECYKRETTATLRRYDDPTALRETGQDAPRLAALAVASSYDFH